MSKGAASTLLVPIYVHCTRRVLDWDPYTSTPLVPIYVYSTSIHTRLLNWYVLVYPYMFTQLVPICVCSARTHMRLLN